jgi:hypothetical protein
MSFLDESLLRRTFRVRLKTVSNLPAEEFLEWENQNFKPPEPDENQPWVREHLRILDESKTTQCHIETVGQMQYVVNIPKNRGTKTADALTQSIAEAFESGQSLTATGLTVILEHTNRSPYMSSDDDSIWIFKTVTARWRVFTASST